MNGIFMTKRPAWALHQSWWESLRKGEEKSIFILSRRRSLFRCLVKMLTKKTMAVSAVRAANVYQLIESGVYIFLPPSPPPRSLSVDKGERLGWKLIFQNNCYSLRQGGASVSKAFFFFLLQLLALQITCPEEIHGRAQPLAPAIFRAMEPPVGEINGEFSAIGWWYSGDW